MLVSLDPSEGSEAAKVRPAVIVSNNTANIIAVRRSGVITVVPVTSNIVRVHPFQTLLPAEQTGLPRDSKAQAEQVRSIPVTRVQRVVGWVPAEIMGDLEESLRLHLSL